MKNHRNLLIYLLLAAVFVLLFSTHTICAQDWDALEIIDYGGATYVYYYGYNQQKLPPTKYPNLEQIGQNALKIWGGPYLTDKDSICYSLINTKDSNKFYSGNYDIEIELDEQWYLILSEYCGLAGALVGRIPGDSFINSVRDDNRQKLRPGKYRLVDMDLNYGGFEILGPNNNQSEKPTAYDWQFLDRSIMSILDWETGKYFNDEAEQNGLKIIVIENQPIKTTDEFLYFSVDLETDFVPFWKNFCVEVKIDGMWRALAYYDMGVYYHPELNSQISYVAYYRMGHANIIKKPIVLTPKMVSFPKIWAPAGPFVGEHRICGNLFVGDSKTVLAYAEFEVVEVPEPNIAAAGASVWAQETVRNAISDGLVPQNLQGYYQQPITRAEFTTLAIAFLKAETESSTIEILRHRNLAVDDDVFIDTDDYYVLAAQALGIVEGLGGELFDPNGNITREQLATMLARTQVVLEGGVAAATTFSYADRNLFSPWAIPSIDLVSSQGIMSGVGNNHFDPKGNCTREQAIVTYWRMRSM